MPRYASTIFLSAFLLFQVQPLIAKHILPWFGGGPAVWTTCMLFFQAMLLGGYLYAHLTSVGLSARRQGVAHLALLVASLAILPIAPSEQWKPQAGGAPAGQILLLLLAAVGGPYFMLSSTSPLMQRWFSRSFPGRSPYRLYALSNFGSLLALLSYPVLVEPALPLRVQESIWSWAYVAFVALAAWCAIRAMRLKEEPAARASAAEKPAPEADTQAVRPGAGRMLLWLALSATGSALLLATTNQMCDNVAVFPFLWVLPLSLYLLTFVICFDNPRWYDRRVFGLLMLVAVPAACWLMRRGLKAAIPEQVGVYSIVMFACCMACHGELARSRPHPRHLTLFYLLVSAGGALGGLFVAVAAPVFFAGLWEYPISLASACLLTLIAWRVNRAWQGHFSTTFWIWAVASLLQCGVVVFFLRRTHAEEIEAIDLLALLGVSGLIHLFGWAGTAAWEDRPRSLAWLWGAVSMAQIIWVIAYAERRFPGVLSARQCAALALCVGAVALCLGALAGLFRRWINESWRQGLLIAAPQAVFGIGLGVLAYGEAVVGRKACVVLAGVYAALHVLGFLWSRASWRAYVARGVWLWAPLATALAVLGMELRQESLGDEAAAIHASRNFYGVLRVALAEDDNGQYRSLTHGRIEHGMQYLEGPLRSEPTTYYGPDTGVGIAIRLHPRRSAPDPAGRDLRVGVVGLGAGTLAAYGRPGDYFRFYEINPQVVELSSEYFSYLKDSAAQTEVALGDARISMERELAEDRSQQFDVLAIDAFNGDAIPVHLLTGECADIYRRHLKSDGLLLLHITNRYIDLNPVARALGDRLGWQAIRISTENNDELGVYRATWIILTANQEFTSLAEVQAAHCAWEEDEPGPLLWTDDFAALWRVISPQGS